MLVKSEFYWEKAIIKQEGKNVVYWELLQKLPNSFIVNLAEVGPLPDRCTGAHKAGLHNQSQFTCRVKNESELKSTETIEEAILNINKYFGIYQD